LKVSSLPASSPCLSPSSFSFFCPRQKSKKIPVLRGVASPSELDSGFCIHLPVRSTTTTPRRPSGCCIYPFCQRDTRSGGGGNVFRLFCLAVAKLSKRKKGVESKKTGDSEITEAGVAAATPGGISRDSRYLSMWRLRPPGADCNIPCSGSRSISIFHLKCALNNPSRRFSLWRVGAKKSTPSHFTALMSKHLTPLSHERSTCSRSLYAAKERWRRRSWSFLAVCPSVRKGAPCSPIARAPPGRAKE
jgi:hypothetical protein